MDVRPSIADSTKLNYQICLHLMFELVLSFCHVMW